MAIRSCRRCIYYTPSRSYCLKLMKKIENPDEPPCMQISSPQNQSRKGSIVAKPVLPKSEKIQIEEEKRLNNNSFRDEDTQMEALAYNPTLEETARSQTVISYPPQQYQLNEKVLSSFSTLVSYKLPSEFRDYYTSTGIPYLDEILGGGFLRGKTYLVAGETGCGKTIFSLQFLIYGALHGEPGVYIAIDEPTDQLIKGIKQFGWDVTPLIKARKLLFLDMRTHFSKIYLRDERKKIEPKYIIESIIKNAKEVRARRLVIDPIAPLIYGGTKDDVLYAREFLREMVFAIEKTGKLTTVMTSEIPTGSKQLSRFGVEEFLASGIIVLGLEEIGGRIERVMYIRKARWSPVRPGKFIFDIIPGTGIVIKGPLEKFKS